MSKNTTNRIPVLVTTEHRGVFFGYIDEADATKDQVKLYEKQMCTYYSSDMRGVFGLAKFGPSKTCKIGAPVPWAIIKNITSIVLCTEEAAKNWAKAPWAA